MVHIPLDLSRRELISHHTLVMNRYDRYDGPIQKRRRFCQGGFLSSKHRRPSAFTVTGMGLGRLARCLIRELGICFQISFYYAFTILRNNRSITRLQIYVYNIYKVNHSFTYTKMTPTVDKTFSYKRQSGYETIGAVAFTTPRTSASYSLLLDHRVWPIV